VNDFVPDASVPLWWFLEDEANREYRLKILESLASKSAVVPPPWFYEVVNGLLVAQLRKRITELQVSGFLSRVRNRTIRRVEQTLRPNSRTARRCAWNQLFALAMRLSLPLATVDSDLLKAAVLSAVPIVVH